MKKNLLIIFLLLSKFCYSQLEQLREFQDFVAISDTSEIFTFYTLNPKTVKGFETEIITHSSPMSPESFEESPVILKPKFAGKKIFWVWTGNNGEFLKEFVIKDFSGRKTRYKISRTDHSGVNLVFILSTPNGEGLYSYNTLKEEHRFKIPTESGYYEWWGIGKSKN